MLLKSPESHNNCVHSLQYTSAARKAFHVILKSLDFSSDKKLLLPAYIGVTEREGSGVFDPVEEVGVPYDFYALDRKLRAMEDDLYGRIQSGEYLALLMIHYFGFCQNDMEEIVYLCQKHNVLLIEDCAHTMYSEVQTGLLGMLGDFSFYSIHKYLATTNGGCLRVNNSEYMSLLNSPQYRRPKRETLDMIARADLKAIREKRRSNYLHLAELIDDFQNIDIMYPELPSGIAPHNFPIIIKNGQRESVYFKLIDDGIPVVALYYRMINQIKERNFDDSLYLSDNILNLPIHQDIEKDDLDVIAEKLNISLKV